KEWPQSQHAKAARSRIKELKGSPTRRWLLQGLGGAVGLAAVSAGLIWTFQPRVPPGPPTPTEPPAATAQSLRTFTGHNSYVSSVAFSPDGRTALSGSNDKTLKLWEVATGIELRTFTGHSASVTSVAFSPDGRTALSGSGGNDGTLKLWDVAT